MAPLKILTLPRLELSAALLLSKLIAVIKRSLKIKIDSIHLWSDSTALCRIKTSPCNLQTFVANRVAEIQELTDISSWRHVPSKENPADALSKGVPLEKLLSHDLWWHGPLWLVLGSGWPEQNLSIPTEIPEQKTLIISAAVM